MNRVGYANDVPLAVSSNKRNNGLTNSVGPMLQQCYVLSINGERRFIIEPPSLACMERQGDDIELVLGVDRQVRSLRHVLAQQAIGVLV